MDKKCIILGICGVTNSGKSTLTRMLKKLLPNVQVIAQDSYFLPQDSPKHILIQDLNHFNWEVLTSLDMEKMYNDIKKILNYNQISTKQYEGDDKNDSDFKTTLLSLEEMQLLKNKLSSYNLLIIEGFSIFNYKPIEMLCDLKFYLTLDKETCYKRRIERVYDPPDVPGYFNKVVWPEHIKQLEEVKEKCKNIIYLTQEDNLKTILKYILNFL